MNYKEYHPDWKDVIRPKILERDNYRCRHCKVRHKSRAYRLTKATYMEVDNFMEEWAKSNNRKVITVYLQVAHLDHDKSNNNPNNLIALCPICHGRYDKTHKQLMSKIFKSKMDKSTINKISRMPHHNQNRIMIIKNKIKEYTGQELTFNQLESILLTIQN